ncbi:MAG: hypothetical protein DRN20_06335, partial [Thermoplasmata archaeon]
MALLGALILDADNEYRGQVKEIVDVEDFTIPFHRAVYKSIYELLEQGIQVDLVSLSDHLAAIKAIRTQKDIEKLTALVEGVPSVSNALYYAQQVRSAADARKALALIESAGKKLREMEGKFDGVYDVLDKLVAKLLAFKLRQRQAEKLVPVQQAIRKTVENIELIYKGEATPVYRTGFKDIDNITGGFSIGELIVVAGDTSIGKTAFCTNLMVEYLSRQIPVLYISAEMSAISIGKRLLQIVSQIEGRKIRLANKLSPTDFTKIVMVEEHAKNWQGYIWAAAPSVPQIRTKLASLNPKPTVIMVDYLQLLRHHRGDTRAQQISAIANDLKAMAVEQQCIIILISQLHRSKDSKPSMHALKESGDIENAADIVLLMHRPENGEFDV